MRSKLFDNLQIAYSLLSSANYTETLRAEGRKQYYAHCYIGLVPRYFLLILDWRLILKSFTYYVCAWVSFKQSN